MPAFRVNDVVSVLADLAPLHLAEAWDNVGLILGEGERVVERVITCLTITSSVAAEAIDDGVSLIVSHHPLLFRPVQRITAENAEGRVILQLLRAGVAVYSPHTAYDSAGGGINDQLAALLELEDVRPLRRGLDEKPPDVAEGSCKLVVFVPMQHLERVARALFDAGAGRIGEYSECSFRTAGVGTFFGSEVAHPAVGQKGRREEVDEYRLEVVCPVARVNEIVQALRKAHPYEEPAYDVYSLRNEQGAEVSAATSVGPGRQGRLPRAATVAELAEVVKERLRVSQVGIVGDPQRVVSRVAVACGSGGEFLADAAAAGCDVFLTGEARFHTLLEAEAAGMAMIVAGHYATERFAVERLAERLAARLPDLHVFASQRECDPLRWQ